MGNMCPKSNRSRAAERSSSSRGTQRSLSRASINRGLKQKYEFIPDNYTSFKQVTDVLRNAGLESSNLIIGIDFTLSNQTQGKDSFNNCSLHAICGTPNPYEKAISIIGQTLETFDEDNFIPCFGFGDETTKDEKVFSFHYNHTPCNGLNEVLTCYKIIAQNVKLHGPTSYAPIVDAAVDIVKKSDGLYHILVIIADGQVTKSMSGRLSTQEEKTINSIITASNYPLSIVLVGVGDGPWGDMKKFDDKIRGRLFDNFQFVNFTEIMSKNIPSNEKEAEFALAALMEIPNQYKAIKDPMIIEGQNKAKQVETRRQVELLYPPRPF